MKTYGLGMSEEYRAHEMDIVRQMFKSGNFRQFKTIEDWIDECIHPAFVEDALKLVERLKKQQEGQSK